MVAPYPTATTTWKNCSPSSRWRSVAGSATVVAYARDDLMDKRRPVIQRGADCIARKVAQGGSQKKEVLRSCPPVCAVQSRSTAHQAMENLSGPCRSLDY